MLRFLRRILFGIAVLILLICALFAVIQTQWAKQQIQEKILSSLHEIGIDATLSGLSGQLPFTWIIQEADIGLQEDQRLKLSDVKLRFAILPLLKGKVTINYLKAENVDYSYLGSTEPFQFSIENSKAFLRKKMAEISLPCPITLHYLAITQLHILNRADDSSLSFGMTAKAKITQDIRDFALELTFISPDQQRTYLEATLSGSEKMDFIDTSIKAHLDLFSTDIKLNGPWTSWEEILYDKPLSAQPLIGEAKGVLEELNIPDYEVLNRPWRFKTKLAISSSQHIDMHNLLLLSNLIHIKGKAQWNGSLEMSRTVLAYSMPDLSLLTISQLKGSAQGKAYFQEGEFKGSFQTRGFQFNTFSANTTRGIIKGNLEGGDWEGEVRLSSEDSEIPFESAFAFEYAPEHFFSINDLVLTIPDGSAHGYLSYDIPRHLYDGSVFSQISHLDRFGFLIHEENINGNIAAECILSSTEEKQNAKLTLLAKNLHYQDTLLDDLTVSAEIEDLFCTPLGRFNLLAEKVYTPQFYLDRLNLSTHSDEVSWPFSIHAEGRIESPFQCYAKGFWRKENPLFTLELTQFFGDLSQIPFSLKNPCEFELGADYMNLSPFDFLIGGGHLYTTFELSPVRSLGKWDLNHFPLEILGCIRPRFKLNGFISSNGFFDASAQNLEGVVNAVIEEAAVLHFGKKEPFRTKGSLQAHLNHSQMQVHTDIRAIDSQFLNFNATLPIDYTLYPFRITLDKTKNTSAELMAEGKLQDLFDFVNLGTNHFTGLISSRLFLSQTLSRPSLQGQIDWQNGSYENYFTGISLRNINAEFEAKNAVIELLNLTAADDKVGTMTMEGKIFLEPQKLFPYAFNAELHNLHTLGFDMIDCNLTGPLYLTGDLRNMSSQGNLIIEEGKIQITESLPYETPSLPVTYVNRPSHLASKTTQTVSKFSFLLDLEVTANGNVLVEGSGLNAELEGNVHLQGKDTNVAASGALKLIKGEYQFAGKVFKLTEGEIIFNDKPTPSAYLNLNGTLSLPEATITAMLRGPLLSPQLTFQSNPQKSTSAILALILFNKDIADISHPEAIQLATTLVSLSGGAGPDVLETIRKSIGIDRLNIASTPGSDEIAVQIGKYITRGIMITLSQSATSSQVMVEVELPHGFIFQAETQEEEEGKFSLKWRKSY